MIGIVGAVAPGPGSRVSATVSVGRSPGEACRGGERRGAAAVHREVADRHGRARARDDPRLVDLRAARRRQVAHHDRHGRAAARDRREAGRAGAAVGCVRTASCAPGLAAASRTADDAVAVGGELTTCCWSWTVQVPRATRANAAAIASAAHTGRRNRAGAQPASRRRRRSRHGLALGDALPFEDGAAARRQRVACRPRAGCRSRAACRPPQRRGSAAFSPAGGAGARRRRTAPARPSGARPSRGGPPGSPRGAPGLASDSAASSAPRTNAGARSATSEQRRPANVCSATARPGGIAERRQRGAEALEAESQPALDRAERHARAARRSRSG